MCVLKITEVSSKDKSLDYLNTCKKKKKALHFLIGLFLSSNGNLVAIKLPCVK